MDDILWFLAWYAALLVAGMLGLPLAWRGLGSLPDRGLTLARLVGLLAIATVYGLIALTGFVATGLPSAILAIAIVAAGSAACLLGSRASLFWDALRVHARELWLSEAIFLAALAAWALVRAHHPDILATGKPEEFTLFNGLLRSRAWPPHDPWLSGHAVAQPYFGWVFIVCLTAVTGAPSGVAFNLAVATVFALSVSGVFAIVANMNATIGIGVGIARDPRGPDAPIGRRSLGLAALAPVVIIVAGNLYGGLALLHANGALADLTVVAPRITQGPAVEWVAQNVWSWLDTQGLAGPPSSTPERFTLDPGFWWWYEAGRVINDRGSADQLPSASVTTTFPALSFVLGDLEPHVLGLPWALLAIGVSLAGTRLAVAPPRSGASIAWLMAAMAAFGALSATSLGWAPLCGGLIVVAPTLGRMADTGWRRAAANRRELALGLAPILLGLAAYSPFLATLAWPGWRLSPNLEDPTRLQQAIVAYFPILWLMMAFLVGGVWLDWSTLGWQRAALIAGASVAGLVAFVGVVNVLSGLNPPQVAGSTILSDLTRPSSPDVVGLVSRRLLDGWTTVLPALGLGISVAGVLGWSRRGAGRARDGGSRVPGAPTYALLLVGAACLAFLLPEWIFWRDEFGSRSATLAHLSLQGWVLGGVGAWVGVCGLAGRLWPSGNGSAQLAGQRLAVYTGLALTGVFVSTGMLYTVLAVRSTATTDPASLDGMAYVARTFPDDWAAAVWLSTQAEPGDVLVEAVGGDDWATGTFSRMSMITGHPTVVGWPGHEARWRAGAAVDLTQREADVARLYVTHDSAELTEILARYNVSYVVVGSLEQTAYDIPADSVILSHTCGCLDVAFTQGSLVLLRVVNGGLP